jgi:hypothetical protein
VNAAFRQDEQRRECCWKRLAWSAAQRSRGRNTAVAAAPHDVPHGSVLLLSARPLLPLVHACWMARLLLQVGAVSGAVAGSRRTAEQARVANDAPLRRRVSHTGQPHAYRLHTPRASASPRLSSLPSFLDWRQRRHWARAAHGGPRARGADRWAPGQAQGGQRGRAGVAAMQPFPSLAAPGLFRCLSAPGRRGDLNAVGVPNSDSMCRVAWRTAAKGDGACGAPCDGSPRSDSGNGHCAGRTSTSVLPLTPT